MYNNKRMKEIIFFFEIFVSCCKRFCWFYWLVYWWTMSSKIQTCSVFLMLFFFFLFFFSVSRLPFPFRIISFSLSLNLFTFPSFTVLGWYILALCIWYANFMVHFIVTLCLWQLNEKFMRLSGGFVCMCVCVWAFAHISLSNSFGGLISVALSHVHSHEGFSGHKECPRKCMN